MNSSDVSSYLVLIVCTIFVSLLITTTTNAQDSGLPNAIEQGEDDPRLQMLKISLRRAYNKQLEFFEEQEAQLMKQIQDLEAQKEQIQTRKRSHVQCLVNVIACYGK